jgi:fatty-acyl-CoA synthase
MFHVHAWGLPYLMTFLGAKQVYPGRYEPPVILKLVTHEGVTFSHCVPTIIHLIVSSQVVKNVNLSGWKVIMGGSALPKGLCKAALELGINIYSGYGMSETCPVLGLSNLKPYMLEWDNDAQSDIRCRAGLPAPGIYMEIWDSEGKPVPRDGKTTGEVVVRGPWLTQGYMNDPEKSDSLWEGGWLHTGDIGFIDGEGYLQITDRMKDVIKTGGEWISSILLEDILSQHHAASEAAVIGVPDEKWGERPHALVVLKEPYRGKVTEDDIKGYVLDFVSRGDIPKYGVPGKVTFVDEIAKTSVGKINKLELRKKFA